MTNIEYYAYFIPMVIGLAGLFETCIIFISGIILDAIIQKKKKA